MAGMSFHDVLEDATLYSFGACVVSLPLLIFRPARPFIALAINWLSYIWGLWLWLTAFGFLLSNWGWLPVIIGIFLAGVGVVPVAMFMALIHGDFGNFFLFLVAIVLLIGSRLFARRLVGLRPSDYPDYEN
jgi:hypothetical protein